MTRMHQTSSRINESLTEPSLVEKQNNSCNNYHIDGSKPMCTLDQQGSVIRPEEQPHALDSPIRKARMPSDDW